MADLRDKVNVLEQLQSTLTSTGDLPRRPPGSNKDLSLTPPPPLSFVH
jgi:hypothetical protein